MKILQIQNYLREHGLQKAVETFKLKVREYPHKVLLKYDQLESSMGITEVQECRGLILEKDTWNVMCMSFLKFFNSEEGHAVKIDWKTAHVLEKLDGTMIQLYWDKYQERWFAATTGTAEGEGEVNNKMGTTFDDLFWDTLVNKYPLRGEFNKDYIYVFELTTPYNIVVKPHAESTVSLLAVRDLLTLEELPYKMVKIVGDALGVPVVKAYDINAKNFGALMRTFEGMPYTDEGYVVVDGNMGRAKVKNPAYVAVHHMKGKTAEHNILAVVKSNEIDEFAATFPERKEEIYKLKVNYDILIGNLESVWGELQAFKPKNITKEEQKKYAMKVFELADKYTHAKSFTGLFFNLKDGKAESVKEYLFDYDNKQLYKML